MMGPRVERFAATLLRKDQSEQKHRVVHAVQQNMPPARSPERSARLHHGGKFNRASSAWNSR
jgi:hypothetical protein